MLAELINVSKEYQAGDQKITALQPTDFRLLEGQLTLILGPSGSGKTTLLSLLGCVIYPTSGDLYVMGEHVNKLNAKELAKLRLENIGFVFQQFNLLAPLNAEDNIAMPLKMQGVSSREIKQRVQQAMEMVDMADRRKSLPKQMSGGQQQRVAIARALVTNPKIILCDEPTASLDKDSLAIVMSELKMLAKEGKAVAVVTHDPRLQIYADRAVEVKNGFVSDFQIQTENSH
jgi:putative ABC transport system ATP-binding protein